MGVVVFDSDVLIGFVDRDDAHHLDALKIVGRSLGAGSRRLLSVVNYAEVMVGPTKVGRADKVREMIGHFGIELVPVDDVVAAHAATIRADTGLKLPDAFVLATVAYAEIRGWADVTLASFDAALVKADRKLRRPR